MCFSIEMSAFMFGFGILTSSIAYNKTNIELTSIIAYFTIMQAIHILGYLYINDCNNIINRFASYSNYIHISFQPFFTILGIYGLMKYTNNIDKNSIIRVNYALSISFVIGLFLLSTMFYIPIINNKLSTKRSVSCGWCGKTCSFKGEKHINFSLPLRYPSYTSPSLFIHMFGMFVLPLFINKFAAFCSLILFITTFIPAYIHGIKTSEAGTIWCFTSILQCIVIILLGLFWKK
jgi:hypothetical protein